MEHINENNPLIKKLITMAVNRHGKIFPSGNKRSFSECISLLPDDSICFYYDDSNGSTHIIKSNNPIIKSMEV